MPVKRICLSWILFLTLLCSPAQANEPAPDSGNEPGVEDNTEELMDFLEFLGDWETENGDWVDPEEMEQIQIPDANQSGDEDSYEN